MLRASRGEARAFNGDSVDRLTVTGAITSYTGTGVSEPDVITEGPDGALWFTIPGSNSIGCITTQVKITNYTG